MYSLILALHNILRWVVLILGIAAAVLSWTGWLKKKTWQESNRRLGNYFTMFVDIQFLLGLLLFIFFSPLTRTAFQDFGMAMGVPDMRFFALEHPLYMILMVVCAHLGSVLPRKVEDSQAKYRRAAILYSLAVLLTLIGMPWSRPILPGLS